jgi:hypothetical protein
MNSDWTYKGKPFELPEEHNWYGFVYLITNKTNGMKYCGKKFLFQKKTRQVKGKKKRYLAESDWREYFGSNDVLKEEVSKNGSDNYRREIIHLCETKAECAYLESKEIFDRGAILSEDYYNGWVSCKITRRHLAKCSQRLLSLTQNTNTIDT